jgi:hypothetical protein
MDFNSTLNIAIPILIVVFFVGLFYMKLKGPVDAFFGMIGGWIKQLFLSGKEASESVTVENTITYN